MMCTITLKHTSFTVGRLHRGLQRMSGKADVWLYTCDSAMVFALAKWSVKRYLLLTLKRAVGYKRHVEASAGVSQLLVGANEAI